MRCSYLVLSSSSQTENLLQTPHKLIHRSIHSLILSLTTFSFFFFIMSFVFSRDYYHLSSILLSLLLISLRVYLKVLVTYVNNLKKDMNWCRFYRCGNLFDTHPFLHFLNTYQREVYIFLNES